MTVAESKEYLSLFNNAEDIASSVAQSVCTAHVLLAFYAIPNKARAVLESRGISEDTILNLILNLPKEPRKLMIMLKSKCAELASTTRAQEIDSLHVLIAITRLKESFAYQILEQAEPDLNNLRIKAMSYSSSGLPANIATQLNQQIMEARVSVAQRGTFHKQTYTTKSFGFSPLDSLPVSEYARPLEDKTTSREPKKLTVHNEPPAQEPAAVPETMEKTATPASHQTATATTETAPAKTAKKLEDLRPERDYPTLAEVATDLLEQAADGDLDEVICRDEELQHLLDILGKRRSNNPCLIGPPGVGKTAIVEGLALKIFRGDDDVSHMQGKKIMALDTGALIAGTSLRGAFSERLCKIKDEVLAAKGRIIVFIDEIHTLIGAGSSGEGAQDAANELKTALARGHFPCIGATTEEEYKKYIEQDQALERRFTPIYVEEPTPEAARVILEAAIDKYNEHHGVTFSPEAIEAACNLSARFIPDQNLPDKAFTLIDLAGSHCRRMHKTTVNREDIAQIVHKQTKVPLERLLENNQERLASAEKLIKRSFIGHDEVVCQVCDAVRRGYAGFNGKRPFASLLFLGPTGVGKTELCKALAELLFSKRDAICRLDMSEFSESNSVARLIGSPAGYVGHEDGGQLTNALRKQSFQLVLFDEIEKAHRDVQMLLLQILDEGFLTDTKGHKISFANTLIVMTSNLGFENGIPESSPAGAIGFGRTRTAGSSTKAPKIDITEVLENARKKMPPELWSRIDEKLVFKPLTEQLVRKIAQLQLKDSANHLLKEREIQLIWEEPVVEFLLRHDGFSLQTGARGMRQAIQHHLEAKVAKEVVAGNIPRNSLVEITVNDNDLALSIVE